MSFSSPQGYVFTFELRCCGAVRLYGLWFGLIAGYSVTTFISGAAVLCSDWSRIAKQAQERSEVNPRAPGEESDVGHAAEEVSPSSAVTATCGGGLSAIASQSSHSSPLLLNAAPTGMLPQLPPMPDEAVRAAEAEAWDLAD